MKLQIFFAKIIKKKNREVGLIKNDLSKALKATLPVLPGYLVIGAGFGIVLNSKGYGVLWAFLMGTFIYAGSMQYAAIDLLSGGASLVAAALTTLMVNARHIFYGLSVLGKYKGAGAKKPYLIFALTDETYSLVGPEDSAEETDNAHNYYFFVSLLNHIYWIIGCVSGSLIGSIFNFAPKGIDFALTALFVSVFTEQWLSTKDHAAALIGILSSAVCLIIFGADNFLIPSMILITVLLALLKAIRREKK